MSTMHILGCLLFGSAFVVSGVEMRICRRIEKQVRGQPDALTKTEIWLNTRRFIKHRKLAALAEHSSDVAIREDSRKAMALDNWALVLAGSGLALMILGVQN